MFECIPVGNGDTLHHYQSPIFTSHKITVNMTSHLNKNGEGFSNHRFGTIEGLTVSIISRE